MKNLYLLAKHNDEHVGLSYIMLDEEFHTYGVVNYKRAFPSYAFNSELLEDFLLGTPTDYDDYANIVDALTVMLSHWDMEYPELPSEEEIKENLPKMVPSFSGDVEAYERLMESNAPYIMYHIESEPAWAVDFI